MRQGDGMPVGNKPAFANEIFPMSLFEPHRQQADSNHGQTLERLAERGGLSWCEALAILEDREWSKCDDAETRFLVRARTQNTPDSERGES